MWAVRTDAHPAGAQPDRAAPRQSAQPHTAQVLLALQRTGGNQAVARLVGGSAAPHRTLARFGVEVHMDDVMNVERIDVHGRPRKRLIPGAEGSHVTAWAVFADLVRRTLVGLDTAAALTAVRGLLAGQIASLGLEWPDPKPKPVTEGISEAQVVVDAIDAGASAGVALSQLQEAIAHYLTLHNLRKGTAVQLGKGQAIGAGEPKHLSTLRLHEGGTVQTATALRAALLGLLDTRALEFIGALPAVTPNAPGIDPADADRVGNAVLRGLHDLAEAYPRSYAAAITKTEVENWLTTNGLPSPLPGAVPVAAATAAAPAGWSRAGKKDIKAAEVNKRTALCQILLDEPETEDDEDLPGATDAVVRDVITAGRPPTQFKGNQGHHTVAFKLESLRLQALKDKTLAEAAKLLQGMATAAVVELDEALAVLAAEDSQDPQFDASRAEYTNIVTAATRDDLKASLDGFDPDATDAAALLLDAQEIAAAWMRAVAVLPLISAEGGSPAAGKGEGKAIAVVQAYEEAAEEAATTKKRLSNARVKEARESLVKLLDKDAVTWVHDDESTGLGYPESGDERVGLILRRWLRAIKDAFPRTFDDTGVGTESQLQELVSSLRVRLDAKEVVRVALELDEAPDLDAELEDVEDDEPKRKRGKTTPKATPRKRKTKRRPPVTV